MFNLMRLCQFSFLLAWPVVTYAAGNSLGEAFTQIKLADWLVVIALSLFSGVVAMMQKLRRSLEAQALQRAGRDFSHQDLLLIDWRVYALFFVCGSLAAGFLAFLLCEYRDVNTYLEAVFIAGSAWGGASIANAVSDSVSERVGSLVRGGTQ